MTSRQMNPGFPSYGQQGRKRNRNGIVQKKHLDGALIPGQVGGDAATEPGRPVEVEAERVVHGLSPVAVPNHKNGGG